MSDALNQDDRRVRARKPVYDIRLLDDRVHIIAGNLRLGDIPELERRLSLLKEIIAPASRQEGSHDPE